MNKIYILIPLLGMIIFGGIFYNFNTGYEARLEANRAAEQVKIKEKAHKDQLARDQAYKTAIESAAKRKAEREERDRVEESKKKARLDAEDRRQRTFEDRRRYRDQAERLRKDVENVKGEIAKLELDKKRFVDEEAFLQDYVKKAEANQKQYYDLIDKIAAADAAKAEAERLAKAAAAAKG